MSEEELCNVGGGCLEGLNLFLWGALFSQLEHKCVHVLLDPRLEVGGGANLRLRVLEAAGCLFFSK